MGRSGYVYIEAIRCEAIVRIPRLGNRCACLDVAGFDFAISLEGWRASRVRAARKTVWCVYDCILSSFILIVV